jgi:geranylgeranyl pyrophosphate synthase
MADLLAERKKGTGADEIGFIHRNKTAAMIEASLVMGGLCAGLDRRAISTLRAAGRSLGLAFQAVDDILDVTAATARLGKTAGKDEKAGKATYVRLYGLAKARKLAAGHSAAAVRHFRKLPGGAPFLVGIAQALAQRGN